MTSAQPALVVRINRPRAVVLRKRERVLRYVAGTVQIVIGMLFLGVVLAFLLPTLGREDNGANLLSLGFGAIVALSMIALGVSSFVYVAKKDDSYWSAATLPDPAFIVHENGLTLSNPEGGEPFEVPWPSVKGMTVKSATIRFRVDSGALPKKYSGQFAFGRSMLDQVPQTISTAMRALSGGRVS